MGLSDFEGKTLLCIEAMTHSHMIAGTSFGSPGLTPCWDSRMSVSAQGHSLAIGLGMCPVHEC
jgi:hypothetical protein